MRILVFGDSITQGFHDEVQGGWCNRLAILAIRRSIESEEYDTSVFNLGISGDNSEDLKLRIKGEIQSRHADGYGVIVFAIGVNDSQFEMKSGNNRVSPEAFEKNIRDSISVCKKFNEQIFVLGITPVIDSLLKPMPWKHTHGYSNEEIRKFNGILEKVSRENSLCCLDMDDVFGNEPEKYLPDGIHPNAEGHRRIFERVKGALEKEGLL